VSINFPALITVVVPVWAKTLIVIKKVINTCATLNMQIIFARIVKEAIINVFCLHISTKSPRYNYMIN
jgi:hypothetical protein